MGRPASLIAAAVLIFLVGVSCLIIGFLFVWAFLNGVHEGIGISPSNAIPTRSIIFGTPIYGALAVIGAVGTWGRSKPAWRLAVAVVLVGIASLVWLGSFDAPADVTAVGAIAIVALGLLVVPSTRDALRD